MDHDGPNINGQLLILELTVKNQYLEIDRVNASFNGFAQNTSLPDAIRRRVNLVFDELLNNIITHAFQDEEEHHIGIRVEHDGSKLVIMISDDGIPYNIFQQAPFDTELELKDRPLGGMGIHLVRNVMDDFLYEWEDGKNNSTLIKYLQANE